MREIKFRAYSKRTKKMYHVLAIFFYQKVVKLSKNCGSGISFLEQIDDVVLMQYTGLKDENSVEIYEGDLVRVAGIFPDGLLKVWFRNGMYHVGNWNMQGFMNAFDFYEVIGNIYETPELLEVEE
ncbi:MULTISPECIES: YopX family protein [Jeotgalibaca]|uniref:YopX family protein n=1 Tax=Jeotgalibaca TaxID=1470540 RepID=UPI0035A1CD68